MASCVISPFSPDKVGDEQCRKNEIMEPASGGTESTGGRWPVIKPKKDIHVNHLKSTHIFTVPNLPSSEEAKGFIEAAESLGFVRMGRKGEIFRDQHRISLNDPELAQHIWESGLNGTFRDIKVQGKSAAGLNPHIRFYRYTVGQKFSRHVDESADLDNGLRTQYTLLIYLTGNRDRDASSDSLVGGETVFYDDRQVVAEVAPVEGMAVLHLHGVDEGIWHEGRVVSKNVKYVLRSDVAFA